MTQQEEENKSAEIVFQGALLLTPYHNQLSFCKLTDVCANLIAELTSNYLGAFFACWSVCQLERRFVLQNTNMALTLPPPQPGKLSQLLELKVCCS